MQDQKNTMNKLNRYIEDHGVKAAFIAKKINIDPSILSRFRKGTLTLFPETLKLLEEFLAGTNSF